MSKRPDVFVFPHVPMRGMWLELAQQLSSLYFHDDGEVAKARAALEFAVETAKLHLEHEDEWWGAALKEKDPDAAAQWEAQHSPEYVAGFDALLDQFAKVEAAEGDARAAPLHTLYNSVLKQLAHDVEHMAFEETQVHEWLWRNFTDDELNDLHNRFMAAYPKEHLQALTPHFLKHHNINGRLGMLTMIKKTAPPEAFQGVMGLTKSLVCEAEFAAIEKALA